MPSCAGYFEPTGSRLREFKSTFNVKNSYAGYFGLSAIIGTIRLEMRVAVQNCRKVHKTPIWRSRLSKVIDFGANRKPVALPDSD